MSKINPMKIAYICTSKSWGGLEMNQVKNAKALARKGHTVFVFGVDGTPYMKEAQEKKLPTVEIHHHHKYWHLKASFELSKKLKENNIQRVIVRDNRDLGLCASAKRFFLKKLRIFYFMEMQITSDKKSLFHNMRFAALEKWSCPLPFLKDQVLKHTNVSKVKVTVIPSGVDLQKFKNLPQQEQARKELKLPKKAFIFGLIGRLDPQKGQHLMLEAFQKIEAQYPSVNLLFLGDRTANEYKEYAEGLKKVVEKKAWQNKIHFKPFSPDVLSFYAAVDVVVMASYNETFGMVTLEALASGKKVIGSNAGGTPDLLGDGKYGLLFKSQDPSSLSEKMLELLNNNETLQDASLDQYSIEQIAESVEELIY